MPDGVTGFRFDKFGLQKGNLSNRVQAIQGVKSFIINALRCSTDTCCCQENLTNEIKQSQNQAKHGNYK